MKRLRLPATSGPACRTKHLRVTTVRYPANPIRGVHLIRSLKASRKGGRHWSNIVADDAIDYLGMSKKDKRPFFMYVAFNAPHDPRQAPKEYIDKYPLKRIKTPENFLPMYPYKDQIGNQHRLRDENLAPMPRTEHAVKVHRQEYYAIIEHMDTQIGRVLDAPDKVGRPTTPSFSSALITASPSVGMVCLGNRTCTNTARACRSLP